MQRLQSAVENTGVSWAANAAAIETRIKAGQNLAFSDADVRDSIAQLATATGDVNKAMDMQGLVMDIARGRNISLGAATDIAQKAALGQFGALKKMGVVLAEGSTATEALGELQQRYAGVGERYGGSTEAWLFKVKDSFGEFQEAIGAALGPAQGLVAMLPGMSVGMSGLGAAASAMGINVKAADVALRAKQVAMLLLTPVTVAMTVAQHGLNAAMRANPIGLVVTALGALALGVKFAYDNFEGFRGVVNGVFGFLQQVAGPVLGVIGGAFQALGKLLGGESAKAATDVKVNFDDLATGATGSAKKMAEGVGAHVAGMATYVPAQIKKMKDAGLADARAMELDTILAAMGMNIGVREAAADMLLGVTGTTKAQKDQIIWDMQVAKVQAVMRAQGMSEEQIATFDETLFAAREKMGQIPKTVEQTLQEAAAEARSRRDEIIGAGALFGEGLALGLDSKLSRVRSAAGNLAWAVRDSVGHVLIEESPSKVAIQQGQWFGEGLATGIGETETLVVGTVTKVGQAAIAAMNAQIAALDKAQSGFLDRSGRRFASLKDLWAKNPQPYMPGQIQGDDPDWFGKTWSAAQARIGGAGTAQEQYDYANMQSGTTGGQMFSSDYMNRLNQLALTGGSDIQAAGTYFAQGSAVDMYNRYGSGIAGATSDPTGGSLQSVYLASEAMRQAAEAASTYYRVPITDRTSQPIYTTVNIDGKEVATAVASYYEDQTRQAGGGF